MFYSIAQYGLEPRSLHYTGRKSQRKLHSMLDKIYRTDPNIVARKILYEMMLVPIRGKQANMQRVLTLNEVGEFIWSRLDGATTLGDILNSILDSFDVEREVALADMIEFIVQLIDEELIVEV